MPSLLLYGGTFNPIHRGHLALCAAARDQLGVDRVLLMPAARPPHKDTPDLAQDRHRLALCRLAARALPGAEVSAYELERGGVSYTIDTLEDLRRSYPGHRIYLLMGSDLYVSFTQWRLWREVAALTTLVVGMRQHQDRTPVREAKAALDREGVQTVLLDHPVLELSSTQVRQELAQTGLSEGLTPEVLCYIRYHRMYGAGTPDGVVDEPLQQLLRAYIRPLMGEERYHHSLCVEQRAVYLAGLYGADPKKAALAGLLHDICKELSREEQLHWVERSGIITPPANKRKISTIDFALQPQLLHAAAAPAYIQEHLGIDDPEILDAVRYHATARGEMTPLDCVVDLADFTSADRDYPDVDVYRDLCEQSMEQAMAYGLRYIVERELPARGQQPCPDTQAAYERYCK